MAKDIGVLFDAFIAARDPLAAALAEQGTKYVKDANDKVLVLKPVPGSLLGFDMFVATPLVPAPVVAPTATT